MTSGMLLPIVTRPMIRPRVFWNHMPTSLAAGSIVAPMVATACKMPKTYQCQSCVMKGLNAKLIPRTISDKIITGRAPTLSMILPRTGPLNIAIAGKDIPAFTCVRLQPNSLSSGWTKTPKEYCPVPTARPVDKKAAAITSQP